MKGRTIPRVYDRKIIVPYDQVDKYIEMIEKDVHASDPFKDELYALKDDFLDNMLDRFTEETAYRHAVVVEMFITFMTRYTDIKSIHEVTHDIVTGYFYGWWERKVVYGPQMKYIPAAMKRFFTFLRDEKQIVIDEMIPLYMKSTVTG